MLTYSCAAEAVPANAKTPATSANRTSATGSLFMWLSLSLKAQQCPGAVGLIFATGRHARYTGGASVRQTPPESKEARRRGAGASAGVGGLPDHVAEIAVH